MLRTPLFLFIVLTLTGCQKLSREPTTFHGVAMTIAYTIKIEEPLSSEEIEKIKTVIASVFSEIDAIYNHWNSLSEVSRFNRLKAGEKMILSPALCTFLNELSILIDYTDGRFDPTMQRYPKNLEAIGWNNVHLNGATIWKDHSETTLDLSGAAKGFAVDCLIRSLQEQGWENLYVEWGGEIRTSGRHLDGKKWRVAIQGTDSIVEVEDAIATSGVYYQIWQEGNTFYTHIIDPRTKLPLEVKDHSIKSVSVIAKTCFEADVLATAFMLFPTKEEAKVWAKKHDIKIWVY